ncbi:MAG TPA: HAD hydrolase family protein [Solirubrobacteraceae bacterium]
MLALKQAAFGRTRPPDEALVERDFHDAYLPISAAARSGLRVAAIGDSRSDVPLFRRVGMSIALNATPDARAVATYVINTEDLRDVLAPLMADR